MKVRDILDGKGSHIASTQPDITVEAAVRSLGEEKVGALVVVEPSGKLCGIISERDVVRRLAASGSGALQAKVADVMTCEVMTCTPDDSVEHLMALMTQNRFRHLPVLEHDRLVGVVSIGDVVKSRLQDLEQETSVLRDYISAY
ncbi:MAG: CBS domain-containing protein [Rhodobacterales bacterium]|nr:CBS domain-containing protein [Rhodobacterales bacterium]